MKKHDEIITRLGLMNQRLINIERLASDKAVKLEQALRLAEKQRDTFKHQRDTIMDERDALRAENEELRRELHALDGRIRQQLQEGDALMAPNNQIISFPEDESIKITHPDGGYCLITRDGIDFVCANGSVLKVR